MGGRLDRGPARSWGCLWASGAQFSTEILGERAAVSGDPVRVTVDSERCIGGGQCEMLEPEVFLLDDETAISSVIGSGVLSRERAEVVVHRCPGAAISIVEPADGARLDG